MRLSLSEDLITDVEEIDSQHSELFRRVENLYESYVKGSDKQEIRKMLDFLGNYALEHFKSEEKCMVEYNYPAFKEHKKNHDSFKKEYIELAQKFITEGLNPDFTLDFNVKIINWINKHIYNEDKILAAFIKQKQNEGINVIIRSEKEFLESIS